MRKLLAGMFILAVLSFFSHSAIAAGDPPLLLRFPTVSKTQIVFNYGGHLWIVSRDGGDARRLTSGTGEETVPSFSPDGTMVAFTGEYDGNRDVFVVQATGGVPRRLTYHPADERVLGWTPDGKSVLYLSWGNSFRHGESQLYTVPVEGGFPGAVANPDRRGDFVFSRRHSLGLRSSWAVARGLEALSRRPDHAHLDCRFEGLQRHQSSA